MFRANHVNYLSFLLRRDATSKHNSRFVDKIDKFFFEALAEENFEQRVTSYNDCHLFVTYVKVVIVLYHGQLSENVHRLLCINDVLTNAVFE